MQYNTQTLGLLHLADELLMLILDNVSSRNDRYSLMRVCRRLSSLAEPYLYVSVLLRDTEDCSSFVTSLANHPERALQIRIFDLDLEVREDFQPVFMIPLLAFMVNLQDLAINSYEEENVAFDEVFNRALGPNLVTNLLWSLRECTLEYSARFGENWALSDKAAIFLHPTLQSLTITGAQADEWAMRDLPGRPGSTSLEELHFHRCDIHARSLADVLTLPRALKRLTISQQHGFPPIVNSPVDVNDYVLAMASQYESLETLTIVRATEFRHSPLRLENLSGLRRLEIDPRVLFTPLNTPSRIANAAAGVARILPAGIEVLVLLDLHEADFKSLVLMLQTVLEMKLENKIVPGLRQIIFRIVVHLLIPNWIRRTAVAANVQLITVV